MDNSAKILLLGKTGVGKSSFINYFFVIDVAKSGYGKPVTQEMDSYEFNGGQYPILIFDTKGLEALDANNQLNDIIETIKKRNNSNDISNWFHTIFYCVSMSGSRFEDFESGFIKKLQSVLSQHIHIILTHCDSCDNSVIQQMKEKIMNSLDNPKHIEIFEVVSIEMKKRNGQEVHPRGKEEVSERVFDLLIEDISHKVADEYADSLLNSLMAIARDMLTSMNRKIDETANIGTLISIFNNDGSLDSDLDNYLERLESGIEKAIENTDEKFNDILQKLAKLYASYKNSVAEDYIVDAANLNLSDWSFDGLDDWWDNLDADDMMSKIMPNTAKYADNDFENESLFSMVKIIFGGVSDLLKIKSRLKNACQDMYNDFMRHLPNKSEVSCEAYERIVEFFDQIY